jgi:hypothetical protein
MAQPQRSIQTFLGSRIAVYRPNKKKYSILEYNAHGHIWVSNYEQIQEGSVSLNQLEQLETVNVILATRNDKMVHCKADGRYLVWIHEGAIYAVPILHKKPTSPNNFPNSYFAYEFDCMAYSGEPPVPNLWILAPLVVPPPLVERAQLPKEIPQRIAWIVAEDVSRKEENCPITLEPISPLTAAVTSCYHVFDANAIASWFESHSECPVCKTNCVITVCFNEK